MKSKLFKRMLTAILAAAMLITSSGFTMFASAADKIYVEKVYAKSYKETMSIGTTKQLKVYVEPEDATVKNVSYSSSNRKVATVSSLGLVTAVGPGSATITISALDGSSKTDTVEVTVLKDFLISKANVDADNEVIVMDKLYGNVTIDSSVGDAVIYLSGITVKNVLTLENGDYTLYLYDTVANKIVIDEAQDEISSLAEKDEEENKAPKLNVGSNTKVNEIQAKVNAMITQEDGSMIEGLRFEQTKEGKIIIYLENYTGKLLLDSTLGDLEVVATGCDISEVTVTGGEDAGNIQLTNGGDSAVENVTLKGAANLELAVPATNVHISKDAKGASLAVKDSVGTLSNAGSETAIKVAGTVDNFASDGDKAAIDVAKGGYVGMINIDGAGSSLTGSGEVSEAYVNADDCKVDVVNTLVVVGEKANNTKIQGKLVQPGSSTTTIPIGGGPAPEPYVPPREYRVGDVIYDNTFDDDRSDLIAFNGYGENPTVAIVADGKDGTKGLRVSARSQTWEAAGVDLYDLIGKHLTIRIEADIMSEADGTYQATIKKNSSYSQPSGMTVSGTAGNWYHLEGTYEITNDTETLNLYFETTDRSVFYIDNFKITVEAVGEAIRVTGITLDKSDITVTKRGYDTLQAIIDPTDADDQSVTWESEDPEIATVDENGVVTGVNDGTTRIVATTNDGGFRAYCNVTVEGDAVEVTPAPDGSVIFDDMDVNTELKTIGWSAFSAKVIPDPANPSNRILEVRPDNYNAAAVVTITIPEGKTLGDFESISYKAQWVSGDVAYKTIRAEAGTTLSGQFGTSDAGLIGTANRGGGTTDSLAEEIIDLNGTLSDLSGTIELAIGISCSGGVYYLDDIVLVPRAPVEPGEAQAITFDFEGSPMLTDSVNAEVATVSTASMIAEVAGDFTTPSPKMLKVVNSNYNSIPKFDITLPTGTSLSDYTRLTATYYGVASTDSGYKPAYLYLGEELDYSGYNLGEATNPGFMATVNNGFAGKGAWNTVSFDLDPALTSAVSGSAIQIAIGMSAPENATYYLDDITLESASGSAIVQDFEGTLTGVGYIGQTTVSATVATAAEFAASLLTNTSSNVLRVLNTDWSGGAVLDVTLEEGTSISDYATVTCKVYLPKVTTPENGYFYKDFYVNLGPTVTNLSDGFTVGTTDKQGSWQTFTFEITEDMKTAIGSATSFQLGIGMGTPERTLAYFIDDITLNPAD